MKRIDGIMLAAVLIGGLLGWFVAAPFIDGHITQVAQASCVR